MNAIIIHGIIVTQQPQQCNILFPFDGILGASGMLWRTRQHAKLIYRFSAATAIK